MGTSEPVENTEITTLDRIEPKGRCRVVNIRCSGSLRKRVLTMGMIPGVEVETIRCAPLGDPTEYLVKGYCLSLRRAEAGFIEVIREGKK